MSTLPAEDHTQQLRAAADTIGRLTSRLRQQQARERAPIAIIGMSVRMPGGADTPEKFWDLLKGGVDATSEFPVDRQDPRSLYDPDRDQPGKAYVMRGGFLTEPVDGFDPAVFGISPREAVGMDPQQRLALELAWEALERAGYAPDSLQDSRTGVFLGVSTTDYVRMRQQHGDPRDIDAYQLVGEPSFMAGRISYTLGLRGPSMVLDTACSGSLVAVHEACRSLRSGESDLVLAGGVNLMLSPYGFVLMSKFGALSPDGRCKTFDAAADGYARGEGGCLLLLKHLDQARADHDNVLAVIRGSAVNHDGRSSGLTVPSPAAQQAVILSALGQAQLPGTDVDYVEAHGTGTSLGDPIELIALDAVLGQGRPADAPLLVGSVKTNIGHLEPAAGAAGTAKVILALQHQQIPPHLHLNTPNPKVPWARLNMQVPTALRAWPQHQHTPTAAISSFGASGTNSHLVLTAADAPDPPSTDRTPGEASEHPRPELLTLSARTPRALRSVAASYAQSLRSPAAQRYRDVAWTSRIGRARHSQGLHVVAATATDAADSLDRWLTGAGGTSTAGTARPVQLAPTRRRRTALMFTGQGAQYPGMLAGLREEPAFLEGIEQCAQHLDPQLPVRLTDLLWGAATDRLNDTRYTQPALFAVEYALGRALLQWGVQPSALIGHSVGEIVAACLGGALELPDACQLVLLRGTLMSALPAGGAMTAVNCDEATARAAIDRHCDQLAVAAVNSPHDVVLSGAAGPLAEVVDELTARGHRAQPLTVSHAFHSPLLTPIVEQLQAQLDDLHVHTPTIPVISNVTGEFWTERQLRPQYWVEHALGAVRFSDGLHTLLDAGVSTFVEVGPAPVLCAMGSRTMPTDAAWIALGRRGADDHAQLLAGLGELHLRGIDLNWQHVDAHRRLQRVPGPTYPWQRERFWFPTTSAPVDPAGEDPARDLPHVGRRLPAPGFAVQSAADDSASPGRLLAHAVRVATAAEGGGWTRLRALQIGPAPGPGWVLQWRCTPTPPDPTTPDGDGPVTVTCDGIDPGLEQLGAPWTRHLSLTAHRARPTDQRGPADETALLPTDEQWGQALDQLQHSSEQPLTGVDELTLGQRPAGALSAATSTDRSKETTTPQPGATQPLTTDGAPALTAHGVTGNAPTPTSHAWQDESELLYRRCWEPVDAAGSAATSNPDAPPPARRALIVYAGTELGPAVADALSAVQIPADLLAVPPPVADTPDGQDSIRLAQQVIAAADQADRIVLTLPAELPDTDTDMLRAQLLPLELLVVELARQLTATPGTPFRLTLCTRGAMPAAGSPVDPAGSTLWGLGQVLALEHPEVWGGLIDLPPTGSTDPAVLGVALRDAAAEDQQALRGNDRYVARLRPWEHAPRPSPAPVHRPGAVLITGGLGGIGLVVADALARSGSSHLVLASRTGLPAPDRWDDPALPTSICDQITAVRRLRTRGVQVDVVQLDVTDQAAVNRTISTLDRPDAPLRGVIHLAGTSDPQFLVDVDADAYERVWAAKTVGAWHLHTATLHCDLDLFVGFSSIAATWGSQHLASYAAGNSFLTGLAEHRRTHALPALTVEWGLWQLASALFGQDVSDFLASVGLRTLDAAQAASLLLRLIAHNPGTAVVSAQDWSRYRPVMEARAARPLLSEIGEAATTDSGPGDGELLSRLASSATAPDPQQARTAVLVAFLTQTVADALGLPATKIGPADDVFSFGLDSLMVMEIARRSGQALGVTIRPNLLFESSRIEQWADRISDSLAAADVGDDSPVGEAGDGPDHRQAAQLARLSQLPADIRLDQPAPQQLAWNRPVLLTGATGFVGAFLLEELLTSTDAQVLCLVRADDPAAGLARVQENLRRYVGWQPEYERRLQILPGDLAQPFLGLDENAFDELAHRVGTIVHCGAWVNFAHTYGQLAPANVGGTEQVLRLSCRGGGIPVHHVSTYGVWGLPTPGRTVVLEDDDLSTAGPLVTGYVQTKWAAEHLVRQAVSRGVPVDTYRLGRVVGDARSGVSLTSHFTNRVLKGSIELGIAPDLDLEIEMTPADYVAKALVHLAGQCNVGGRVVHLVNPRRMSFRDVIANVQQFGWTADLVAVEVWWKALRDALAAGTPNALHPVMDTVEELIVGGEEAIDYDVAHAERRLTGSGIACPPLDRDLLRRFFTFFVASGYLPRETPASDTPRSPLP